MLKTDIIAKTYCEQTFINLYAIKTLHFNNFLHNCYSNFIFEALNFTPRIFQISDFQHLSYTFLHVSVCCRFWKQTLRTDIANRHCEQVSTHLYAVKTLHSNNSMRTR